MDKPTTEEIREWHKRGFTNDPHTAFRYCRILLDRLEAISAIAESHSETIANMDAAYARWKQP